MYSLNPISIVVPLSVSCSGGKTCNDVFNSRAYNEGKGLKKGATLHIINKDFIDILYIGIEATLYYFEYVSL
jgi:hypothetical protein